MKLTYVAAIAAILLSPQPSMATSTGTMQCQTTSSTYVKGSGNDQAMPVTKNAASTYTVGKDFLVGQGPLAESPMVIPCAPGLKGWMDASCHVNLGPVGNPLQSREEVDLWKLGSDHPRVWHWSIRGSFTLKEWRDFTWINRQE